MTQPNMLHIWSSNWMVAHLKGIYCPPLKESELKCYKCGQKGHIKPQCPKLKCKQKIARAQIEVVVDEDNPTDGPFREASKNAQEEVDSPL